MAVRKDGSLIGVLNIEIHNNLKDKLDQATYFSETIISCSFCERKIVFETTKVIETDYFIKTICEGCYENITIGEAVKMVRSTNISGLVQKLYGTGLSNQLNK